MTQPFHSNTSLITATLLHHPAAWISWAAETVTFDRAELIRDVEIVVRVPDTDLSSAPLHPSIADSGEIRDIYLPLLTPRKGVLVDLSQLVRIDSGERIRIATHDEHIALSQAMLVSRFTQTFVRTFAETKDQDLLYQTLSDVYASLKRIPISNPLDARSIVKSEFQGAERELARVSGVTRPEDEPRLYRLCDFLADRYLILAVTRARPGDEVSLCYRYRTEYRGPPEVRLRDRMKSVLGTTPSNLRFPVPLARRTGHYSFRFEAPPGHFFYEQGFFPEKVGSSPTPAISGAFYSTSDEEVRAPAVAVTRGAASVAHLVLVNGDVVDSKLDVGLVTYERPPGSAVFGFVVAIMLGLVMVTLKQMIDSTQALPPVDAPALLLAIMASAPVLAAQLMPRPELFAPALLTRLGIFASALLGNAFALWLFLRSGEPSRHQDWRGDVARFLRHWAGDVLIVVTLLLAALFFWRMVDAARKLRSAYRRT